MASTLVVSWSILPYSKTASSFIANDLQDVLEGDSVYYIGEKTANKVDEAKFPNSTFVNTQFWYQGKGKRFFSNWRWFKLNHLRREISKIILEKNITNIIAFFPDELYMYAAHVEAKKHGIKFIPHFHNTYVENRKGLKCLIAKYIQPKLFSNKVVLVISDGMLNYLKPNYPKVNFDVFRHFLNEQFIEAEPDNKRSDKINLFFVGTINDSNIDATRFFTESIKGSSNIQLSISTSIPKEELVANGILNENVIYLGFVENLEDEYRKSDMMLLSHGFTGNFSEVEYKTIFPTKTVEMLRSGRPILGVMPSDTFIASFLKKHDCAELVLKKDKALVISSIEKAVETNRSQELISNSKEAFKVFDPEEAKKVLGKYLFK